jgi:hypothetical protein
MASVARSSTYKDIRGPMDVLVWTFQGFILSTKGKAICPHLVLFGAVVTGFLCDAVEGLGGSLCFDALEDYFVRLTQSSMAITHSVLSPCRSIWVESYSSV